MVYQLQVVTFHYVLIIHVLFHRWDEIYYTSYVVLVKTRNNNLALNQVRIKQGRKEMFYLTMHSTYFVYG